MRWFRRHRLFVAQAALFALVVQFAVAFGHFHAVDICHDAAAPAAAAAFDVAADRSPAAPNHGTSHPGNDACAICATIHLTGSAQVAASPALPVPITYFVSELSLTSGVALDDPRCFEQRSRGPPQA